MPPERVYAAPVRCPALPLLPLLVAPLSGCSASRSADPSPPVAAPAASPAAPPVATASAAAPSAATSAPAVASSIPAALPPIPLAPNAPTEVASAEPAPVPVPPAPAPTAVVLPPPLTPVLPIRHKQQPPVAVAADDPLHGAFTLAQATKGLSGKGPLVATIETTEGALTCRLLEAEAPRNVASFVGLARGIRPFKDPGTSTWVKRPAYDGTLFHRVIRGFMIQGGDPSGKGSGDGGFLVPDEIWEGGKHDRAGLLCTANRGPNTNSLQFFVTDAAAPHLDGGFTIFGVCGPVHTIHALAAVPVERDRPVTPLVIQRVTVRRAAP